MSEKDASKQISNEDLQFLTEIEEVRLNGADLARLLISMKSRENLDLKILATMMKVSLGAVEVDDFKEVGSMVNDVEKWNSEFFIELIERVRTDGASDV